MKALTPEEQYFAKEILKKVNKAMSADVIEGRVVFTDKGDFTLMLEYEQCTQLETIIEKLSR